VAGDAGRYASPDDVTSLADAIVAVAAVPRAHARDRAARLFSRERWLDGCERLYRQCAGEPSKLAA